MGNALMVIQIAQARKQCEAGVEYSPHTGATCPVCQTNKIKVKTVRSWKDGFRLRYHQCTNPACVVNVMGLYIKSLESKTDS